MPIDSGTAHMRAPGQPATGIDSSATEPIGSPSCAFGHEKTGQWPVGLVHRINGVNETDAT